jgi:broad specificity phosphatase PhoE
VSPDRGGDRRGLSAFLTGAGAGAAGGSGPIVAERRPGDRYLVLVRHGEAAAGWEGDADPGLSDRGRAQAARAAADLAVLAGTPVVASPLRRTRETAAPIAAALGVDVSVDAAVGEVVTPPAFAALDQRGPWLRELMAGRWADADPAVAAWRSGVVSALAALPGDTVVVTHFVAINAAVGAALGDDRVVAFRPGNCSRTVLRIGDDGTTVARLGDEASSVVT